MLISRLFPRLYRRYRRTRKVILYRLFSWRGKLPPVLGDGYKPVVESDKEGDGLVLAVCVTGGLGDFLIVARLLRDLCSVAERINLDLFVPSTETASWVFGSIPQVRGIYSEMFFPHAIPAYDCAIVVNQMAYHYAEHVKYARLSRHAPRLLHVLETLGKSRPIWDTYIQNHPYLDGGMAHRAVVLGENRYTLLHRMFGIENNGPLLNLEADISVVDRVRNRFARWITISNGFDAAFKVRGHRATKCYPLESWNRVVSIIKQKYPDIGIVQVGGKTSELIRGVDFDLIRKTSLAQVAGLIKHGILHVDNEGGLVHVAASLGCRSVVLFGPTSKQYFAYDGNINLDSGFCGGCWWSTKTWMEACPREFETPVCLDRLDPQLVAERILAALEAPGNAVAENNDGPADLRRVGEVRAV